MLDIWRKITGWEINEIYNEQFVCALTTIRMNIIHPAGFIVVDWLDMVFCNDIWEEQSKESDWSGPEASCHATKSLFSNLHCLHVISHMD